MSFDIVCQSCGAPSGPSVGICPFCKSVLINSKSKEQDSPTLARLQKYYNEGNITLALSLANAAEERKPNLLKNANFVLLYVKILIEVDGPSSKIRGLITQALLEDPDNPLLIEYLEIIDARSKFVKQINDVGELELNNLLRRSPKNVHALFLLGSHLFWVEKEMQSSLRLLEQCYRLRPKFLRATACLAALYRSTGNLNQAQRLFRECSILETNKEMKKYFQALATS